MSEEALENADDVAAALKHLGWESVADLHYWAQANDIERFEALCQAFAKHRRADDAEIDRLRAEERDNQEESIAKARKGGNGGNGGGYHPFVEGLLQTMPEPGTLWAIEGRAAWLEAAANVFKLMYQGDGKITVSAQASTNTATVQ